MILLEICGHVELRVGLLDPVLRWLMCWVMAAESYIDGRFVLVGVKICR